MLFAFVKDNIFAVFFLCFLLVNGDIGDSSNTIVYGFNLCIIVGSTVVVFVDLLIIVVIVVIFILSVFIVLF